MRESNPSKVYRKMTDPGSQQGLWFQLRRKIRLTHQAFAVPGSNLIAVRLRQISSAVLLLTLAMTSPLLALSRQEVRQAALKALDRMDLAEDEIAVLDEYSSYIQDNLSPESSLVLDLLYDEVELLEISIVEIESRFEELATPGHPNWETMGVETEDLFLALPVNLAEDPLLNPVAIRVIIGIILFLIPETIDCEEEPSAIGQLNFDAIANSEEVVLRWSTATEIRILGFNLYYSDSSSSNRIKLNTSPIRPKGEIHGKNYLFEVELPHEKSLFYYLEEIYSSGKRRIYGPIKPQFTP